MADSVTKYFQQRIEAWLKVEMEKDPQFAEVVRSNPKKTVQGACNYVLKCAKESKQCGYDDDEVYGMVRHFFDEGDITDPGDQNPSRIVVSGHVDLSESEKAEEGLRMHHCVFSNGYYEKKNTVILSARSVSGARLETVEVNTRKWDVVQSRGLQNNPSPRHAEIVRLVRDNMHLLQACG